jgi:hypothetical protein
MYAQVSVSIFELLSGPFDKRRHGEQEIEKLVSAGGIACALGDVGQ